MIAWAILAAQLGTVDRPEGLEKRVAVVINTTSPDSNAIGTYYAKRRGIPDGNVVRITTPNVEVTDRKAYDADIEAPVRAFLEAHADVLFVVTTYGVPIKVGEANPGNDLKEGDTLTTCVKNRDYCAVDSELMMIPTAGHAIEAWLENSFYGKAERFDRDKFKQVIVCRLDGPTPEAARALVDNALYGEAFGIEGEHYLDTRGLKPDGGYGAMDEEMRKIRTVYEACGLKVCHEDTEEEQDLSTYERPANYWGWYAGDLIARDEFRFKRGAVGAHLHSFSAGQLRSKTQTWTGPLVQHGITGTCGTVYEPLGAGFPDGWIFYERIFAGYTFGEAMMAANRFNSWMAIFVGDPLYSPYATSVRAEQAKHLELVKTASERMAERIDAGEAAEARKVADEVRAIGIAYEGEEDLTFLLRECAARALSPGKKGGLDELRGHLIGGLALLEGGDKAKALERFKKGAAISPHNFDCNLAAARCLDGAAAIDYLRKAVAVVPESFEAQKRLAEALIEAGKANEALDAVAAARKLVDAPELVLVEAEALTKLGQARKAAELLEGALKRDGGNAALRLRMGRLYSRMNDAAKGAEVLGPALKLYPEDSSGVADYAAILELYAKFAAKGKDDKASARAAAAVDDARATAFRPSAKKAEKQAAALLDDALEDAKPRENPPKPYAFEYAGLPRVEVANLSGKEFVIVFKGPTTRQLTVPSRQPDKLDKTTAVCLYPGRYRIAILPSVKEKAIYLSEVTIDLHTHYGMGLGKTGQPHYPLIR